MQEFDEDPIDAGGHGTSVADTIAGMNGIAPGADIIALKVCAGQGGCPGLSIAMGIEWAVKNNVDILNLSLGSDYGKFGAWIGWLQYMYCFPLAVFYDSNTGIFCFRHFQHS